MRTAIVGFCLLILCCNSWARADEYEPCVQLLARIGDRLENRAIASARNLLIRLQSEYQADYDEAPSGREAVAAFNARESLPPTVSTQEQLDLDLSASHSAVSYGMRDETLLQSSRLELLKRLQGLVSEFEAKVSDGTDPDESKYEFALGFHGTNGLGDFLRNVAPALRPAKRNTMAYGAPSTGLHTGLVRHFDEFDVFKIFEHLDMFDLMDWDDFRHRSSDGRPTLRGVGQEVAGELFAIWVPGSFFVDSINSMVAPVVKSVLGNSYGAVNYGRVVQGLMSVAVVARAGVRAFPLVFGHRQMERTTETRQGPAGVHSQLPQFLKKVNDVRRGDVQLARNQLLYFGTSYEVFSDESTGVPDHHLDLILYNDRTGVHLLAFNRRHLPSEE